MFKTFEIRPVISTLDDRSVTEAIVVVDDKFGSDFVAAVDAFVGLSRGTEVANTIVVVVVGSVFRADDDAVDDSLLRSVDEYRFLWATRLAADNKIRRFGMVALAVFVRAGAAVDVE